MRRVFKYILLLLLVLIPSTVLAENSEFEFNCEGDKHYYEDSFLCTISTKPTETFYNILSGTLKIPEELGCEINAVDSGLTFITQDTNKFTLQGTIKDGYVIKYKCKPLKDVEGVIKRQIVVDFNHQIKEGTADRQILRSNEINIVPLAEKTKAQVDTKSRDTSNPNSLLKQITLEGSNFIFSKFLTTYNLEVLYEVENANINAVPNVEGATVSIEGNTALAVGENTIDIKVVSPDGTATTYYTLVITRLARGQEIYNKESDAKLKTLEIEGYSIKFDPDVYEYSIELGWEVQNITLNASPNNEDAKVTSSIPEKLVNGSKIVVTVKSADGTKEIKYTIKIKKVAPKKDYTLPLIIGGSSILFLLLLYFFIKHRQKKQKKDPLLKLKHDKRGLNKGKNFNDGVVPVTEGGELVDEVDTLEEFDNVQPNVINAATVNTEAMPIQVEQAQPDTNLNKTASVVSTIDLTASDKAAPIAVQPQPVQPEPVIPPMQSVQPQPLQAQPIQQQVVQPQVVQQQVVQQSVQTVQTAQPVQQVVMQQPQPQVVPQNVQVIQVGTQNGQINQNNQQ